MNHWTPLWNTIVDSSIWEEDDFVCKVFITLLAIKDEDHIVRQNAYQIGKKANKSEKEVLRALEVLSSPDRKRIEKQEHEGRRITKVDDGWLVLNGQKYQDMIQDLFRQRRQANWQREQRMIEKSIRTGVALNPADLTPQMKARYERAKEKERKRRTKAVEHAGACAGAQQAVAEALEKAHAEINSPAADFRSTP